ncbi:hypothetical protein CPB84DRAFT_248237 [Gymnopilus junonius]|uniref:F-box domain-containing protein n=1 Tax=Gymnopilus junonius TaxID=109634 RepID=A0A9P5TRT7_GYMJU|nr:hypothetical protein CPB84DRAFT_248237 [Gymnopilus junonius]
MQHPNVRCGSHVLCAWVPAGARNCRYQTWKFINLCLVSTAAYLKTSMSELQIITTKLKALELNSPISNLSDDLLWFIFCSNSIMTQETEETLPVFRTLLRSSHVCERWRNLINSSSFLWSQVINLKFLLNAEWREQVMRRTGDALLCITAVGQTKISPGYQGMEGDVGSSGNQSIKFTPFLLQYWKRIRYLNISINLVSRSSWSPQVETTFEREIRTLLEQPARYLETFILNVPQLEDLNVGGGGVFANQAPALKTFFAPSVIVPLTTPWLSHIHDLSLSGELRIDRLLQALSSMPFLETLRNVKGWILSSQSSSPLPKVQLPSLRNIVIHTDRIHLRPYLDFFSHLSPFSKCSLELSISSQRGFHARSDSSYWESAAEIFCILPSFCGLSDLPVHSVQLTLKRSSNEFVGALALHMASHLKVEVSLTATSEEHRRAENILAGLIQTIQLHEVDHFTFIPSRGTRISLFALGILNRVPSTKVLKTSPHGIQCLTDLRLMEGSGNTSPIFFPALQTIELDSFPERTEVPSVKLFLFSRMAGEHRIQTLHVRMVSYHAPMSCREDNRVANIRNLCLEWFVQYTGLKVIFDLGSDAACDDGQVKKTEYAWEKGNIQLPAKVPLRCAHVDVDTRDPLSR